jgi:hypothetical protein
MTTPTREQLNSYGAGYLPGHLGVEILTLRKDLVESRMAVGKHVMAPSFAAPRRSISAARRRCGTPR